MSWFFGKKKNQRDSPPSSEDETQPQGQGDFIFVERRGNEQPEVPAENLYPNINNIPQYPSPPAELQRQQTVADPIQNILNGLPFKLCKELSENLNDDIEIDRYRVNEILSFILRIENDDTAYDFSTEKGVINEMDSADIDM